ncbi:hypothetical protein M4D76_27210, partial [Peribacillus frigoritolerans]|uniref:hypothetical protein n=1 Tax=Peribacillus frigoritolerans TaxID=450367 RepID=UPI0021A63941
FHKEHAYIQLARPHTHQLFLSIQKNHHFGKQGELRERTLQHQLQRASALNIIINAKSSFSIRSK